MQLYYYHIYMYYMYFNTVAYSLSDTTWMATISTRLFVSYVLYYKIILSLKFETRENKTTAKGSHDQNREILAPRN